MFSGIVSHKAKVSKIQNFNDFIRIHISTPKNFNKGLKKGASISVNGVCLTSKDNGITNLKFDVIEETLLKTNLKNISKVPYSIIRDWIINLSEKKLSALTINRKISSLSKFYDFLEKANFPLNNQKSHKEFD